MTNPKNSPIIGCYFFSVAEHNFHALRLGRNFPKIEKKEQAMERDHAYEEKIKAMNDDDLVDELGKMAAGIGRFGVHTRDTKHAATGIDYGAEYHQHLVWSEACKEELKDRLRKKVT